MLYQIAADEVFKAKVKGLGFYYLDNNSLVDFVGTEAEIKKTKDWVVKAIDNILSADFTAKPGNPCQYCDFKQICPFAKK